MNYNEPIYQGSNFTWHEALYLPSWKIHHIPTELEKQAIIDTAKKLDPIWDIIDTPFFINCWLRPEKVNPFEGLLELKKAFNHNWNDKKKQAFLDLNYNAFVGGAKFSLHRLGSAVDFTIKGLEMFEAWEAVRSIWQGRMEHHESTISRDGNDYNDWIHIDTKSWGSSITFNP